MHSINIVSVLIISVAIFFMLRGVRNDFSSEHMFNSIISSINNFLFLLSLILSVYATNKLFSNPGSGGLFGYIQDVIPPKVVDFSQDLGILIYMVFTPILLLLMFFVLLYFRSLADNPIRVISAFLCDKIRGTSRFARSLIGAAIEMPKAFVSVFVLVLILGLFSNYYPTSKLTSFAWRSEPYNLVYFHTVSPVMKSSVGEKVPAFLQYSINEISKGVASSKFIKESEQLKKVGFLRFQYETKSNGEIDAMAQKIVGDEKDERRMAYLLYKWIGTNIEYDWDKYENIINGSDSEDKFGAVPAFTTRKGVCEDYSDLFVAMGKAVGLKTRVIVGQGYSIDTWGGHAWNETYLPKEDKWIPLDATWATMGNYFDNEGFYDDHIFEAVAGEW